MSSQRYSESRSFHEESRRNTDPYTTSYSQGVTLPIQQSISEFNRSSGDQRVQERIHRKDTTLQWVTDPINGTEKFRINVNIDGFNQNEVNIRVEGNKLIVYGEHLENNNQSSAKKIIEKSYELPSGIDTHSPHVSYPTPIAMQIDFPSRHSNTIIDDGRISSNYIANSDTTYRTPPRVSQERSSSEYTSTRKIGGGGGSSSSPRTHSPYDDLYSGNNFGRTTNTYSSTSNYDTIGNQKPSGRDYTSTTTARNGSYNTSTNPTYTYSVTRNDFQPSRTTYPSTPRSDSNTTYETSYSETRRETEQRQATPQTGVQTTRDYQQYRSGNPSIEDRFRTNLNLGGPSIISSSSPSSTRNVEVREYSRRVGSDTLNNNNLVNSEPLFFSQGFNRDAFFRSAFQPQIINDDSGQKRIEMKLDVNNYDPNEIKVSVEGNDLIVKAEHNVERPPTSATRSYFYKQVTLPSNTDVSSLSSQYHPDGRLYITAKLTNEQNSIRYNN